MTDDDPAPQPLASIEPTPRSDRSAASPRLGNEYPSNLPTAAVVSGVPPTPWKIRIAYALPWVLIVIPALYQILLLATAIGGRAGYPYDLEWMEGGMLHHALRIREGRGIYVPPSIDFIPYLYTPLYPSLLAMFSGVFGISYTVGRMLSILSLVGIASVALFHLGSDRHEHAHRGPALAGAVLGLGLFAAAYPFMEGWYDLVRADTLFLYIVTAGIAGLPRWSAIGSGTRGHARVAVGATILALAFFCKQTGIVYVALGGMIVLVVAWRRLATYVAVAGVLGLGGTALLQQATDGWFWVYVRKIHAAHDFNMDRFWVSFGNILWQFRALTVVVVLALVVVLVTRIVKGTLPRGTHPLLLWASTFAVSTLIGAIGWGTEFAHFNAYMPAFLHGGLAAGAAVPALYACARLWWGDRPHVAIVATVAAFAAAVPLAYTCYVHRWEPKRFIPTTKDVAAGDRLIARIRDIEGPVWIPSHPWYARLAGKTPLVHRMGVKDVTARQPRPVIGLDQALQQQHFAALVLDDRDLHIELPMINSYYRPGLRLPGSERPRVYTGARVTPEAIWVPAITAKPPAGARVLHAFEQASWDSWKTSGNAWGPRPANESQPGQDIVTGTTGRRFANSMYDGDKSIGRVISPSFKLEGKLTLNIGGTSDATKLRVELRIGEVIIATASVAPPGGETLTSVVLDPGVHLGKDATLVLVDESLTGHLDVDDIWMWPAPTLTP